jgi:hypothetical protein
MTTTKIATALATGALLITPALAGAHGKPTDPGAGHKPATTPAPATTTATPGPSASAGTKAKAYGKNCQGQSKKHVKGEKGTAFSRCVTAMAKVASGSTDSPRAACKTLSKKHVKGEKGTAYSRCVSAAAKLLKDKHEAEQEQASTPTS